MFNSKRLAVQKTLRSWQGLEEHSNIANRKPTPQQLKFPTSMAVFKSKITMISWVSIWFIVAPVVTRIVNNLAALVGLRTG